MAARNTANRADQADLLRAALDNMPNGFCIWDKQFRLVMSNTVFQRMYRLPDEVVQPGTTLRDMLEASVAVGNHPGRQAPDIEASIFAKLSGNCQRKAMVLEYNLASGRTFRVTYTPAHDGAWVVTHEDISEIRSYIDTLREREEEMLLQNARFDFVVRNMRQGLCMYDRHHRLVFWNPQYADMYNIPPGQMKRGDTIEQVLRVRRAAGNQPVGGDEAFFGPVQVPGCVTPAAFVVKMEDGRAISILHQPLKGGGWVATHFDITEERRRDDRIRHMARHDALTDLPNRILLRERMEEIEATVEDGGLIAILWVDLDHFKTVNDSLGHSIGDALLKEVAQRLLANTRTNDVCARLGGDEFAILHGPLRHPNEASVLAGRVIDSIAEPFLIGDHQIVIGASVGIAVAPSDGREAESLLKAADLACYRAKDSGRGTFHFFEKSMDAAIRKRRELELGLRSALAEGELSLAFQPIYNLTTNKVSGVEALLRWDNAGRGSISPDEFISVAEETGLINPIGEWVLRQACSNAAAWPDDIKIAVNLSAVQFKSGHHLVETVVSALASSGVRPERLELEITESALLFHIDGVLRSLHQLRDVGVRICMDDFGTGYSSLSYLRAFPFDKIKIDRTFVQDSSARHDGSAIIEAVVGLGKTLRMQVVAEGIETAEQYRLVKRRGCDEAQGYLLSKPLAAEEISILLGVDPARLPGRVGEATRPRRASRSRRARASA